MTAIATPGARTDESANPAADAAIETSRRLVAGLLRPQAYPHAVREPIRLTETHISWVLLTGEFAYKVKKPLELSFLDYSTLERRRALCDEELRLNRRLAPDLYLGVSVISGSPDEPLVDAPGLDAPGLDAPGLDATGLVAPGLDAPAVALEYAVRMREFEARDELSALIESGGVTAAAMADLGAAIARFHAAAGPATDAAFGDPDAVHRVTRDNFAELRRLPEYTAWHERLAELAMRLDALHAALRPLMRERRAGGFVRECHGDLHCGNVVRWRGRLTPFDGIEFDPTLRFIDVTSDVAFLAMDLAERGHRAFRRVVLQAWTEALGDFAGLGLLPYYETYRALVRAKVAALTALQSSADSPQRRAAVTTCERYLAWARNRLEPRRPVLIVTCGLSGSGKTWLARRLAPEIDALHVRSDVERKRFAGLAPLEQSHSPADGGLYTREFNARTYARLRECADAALAAGESIVVDAACLRREERTSFLELAVRRSAPAVLLHCTAPDQVLRDRVAKRQAARDDASEAGLDVLARQRDWWEPFDACESPHVVEADTAAPDAVTRALDGVGRRMAPGIEL